MMRLHDFSEDISIKKIYPHYLNKSAVSYESQKKRNR
jgi:hypothetical protein